MLFSLIAFRRPLHALINFALTRDYGSHIILVLPISAYICFRRRRQLFQETPFDFGAGLGPFVVACGFLWIYQRYPTGQVADERLSAVILAIVLLWISVFVLLYSRHAFAKMRFPLLFLFLLVPIPGPLIARSTILLQAGSTDVAYGLLRLLSVPVFRYGFTLVLPTLNIQVAEECSGIRSSIALLMTALVIGEFFLHSFWRRSLLVLFVVPILILKNGMRIVAISLLTLYVDPAFLHGWLHTSGGIVFYLLGLLTVLPVVILLRRSDGSTNRSRVQASEARMKLAADPVGK